MMDEQLIDEVAQHGVIFNRQKYYLNGTGSGGGGGGGGSAGGTPKYETKDEAWQIIAMKMHSDVETCKKRWKYLRERYVSQRKQGDPPVYEHLSRPYLEKMKFLDQHIQPRKSYRNVPNFLNSPHSATSSGYSEFNMDSKSNGSMKGMNHFSSHHHYHQPPQTDQHAMNALSSAAAAASALENATVNGHVKLEADQVFRDFAAAVASQQLQQISQTQQQMQHHHHQQQQHQAVAVAAAMADSSQGYQEHFRDNSGGGSSGGVTMNNNNCTQNGNAGNGLPTTSSPMKSPLSSPLTGSTNDNGNQNSAAQQQSGIHSNSVQLGPQSFNDANNDEIDSSVSSNYNMKKPRVQLNSQSSSGNASSSTLPQHNNVNNNNNNTHTSSAANSQFTDETDDDSDDNSVNMLHQGQGMSAEMHENSFNPSTVATTSTAAAAAAVAAMQRNSTLNNHHQQQHQQQQQQQQQQSMFQPNADFLFQLYQQLPHNQAAAAAAATQQHFNKFQTPQTSMPAPAASTTTSHQQPLQRCSEHLLGELVTTELLKMSKERRKTVQRRILEILFFDD